MIIFLSLSLCVCNSRTFFLCLYWYNNAQLTPLPARQLSFKICWLMISYGFILTDIFSGGKENETAYSYHKRLVYDTSEGSEKNLHSSSEDKNLTQGLTLTFQFHINPQLLPFVWDFRAKWCHWITTIFFTVSITSAKSEKNQPYSKKSQLNQHRATLLSIKRLKYLVHYEVNGTITIAVISPLIPTWHDGV